MCSSRDIENLKIEDIEPNVASATITDELTDDIFTKPLNLAHGWFSFLYFQIIADGIWRNYDQWSL